MSQVTTHDLWNEGRSIKLTASAVSSGGVLTLTWTVPSNPIAYNGAVVLLSEEPMTAMNFPVDGTKYTGSTNWAAPVDLIGEAKVVAAFYGFFGDDITQNTVTVTGLDPSKVYYASIHASSNVLQYHSVGSLSYPLESNTPVKKNSAYAGSIPQAATPPSNPTNGMVYFDVNSNAVLVWSDAQQAWAQANQYPVKVAKAPDIDLAQLVFIRTDQELKFFDGSQWTIADPSNLRVKMGGAWIPYSGNVTEIGSVPQAPTAGDFVLLVQKAETSAPRTYSLKFFSLNQWFNITPDMVQVLINGVWTPIATPIAGNFHKDLDPAIPAIGDFFYDDIKKDLLAWTGSGWVKADTAQEGEPTYNKTSVGTDGSQNAKFQLIREVKTRMGWPTVCVELNEQNFLQAANNALSTFRQLADNAYEHRHISFTLLGGGNTGGQSKYYLNDPRDGTDRIVNVLKIHRINMLGISALSAENGLYAQAFFNQIFQGPNVDVLSIHLMHQLSELYEKIFAGNLVFSWDESRRELTILRRIMHAAERVILEVVMERTEQDLIADRWAKMWIMDWAYADALEQLGLIRSKYSTLPSATGGLSLNGDALLAKAMELKTDLRRQINDFEVGNGGIEFGNCAFLIG